MPTLKNSKTASNLLHAFAGESQARNRYTYYSSIAKKRDMFKLLTSSKKLLIKKKNMRKD